MLHPTAVASALAALDEFQFHPRPQQHPPLRQPLPPHGVVRPNMKRSHIDHDDDEEDIYEHRKKRRNEQQIEEEEEEHEEHRERNISSLKAKSKLARVLYQCSICFDGLNQGNAGQADLAAIYAVDAVGIRYIV